MCNFCFDKEINRFEDDQTFQKFDLELDQKRKLDETQNGLVVLDNNGSYLDYGFQILQCYNCGTIWWFSTPDNAWRGFFMKEVNAKLQLQNFKKSVQKRRIGCFVFILAIVFIIITYSVYV